jgi:DNA-binding GntR family transcriptional regulator
MTIDGAGAIYADLRQRLVTAEFTEGTKLKPETLRTKYGCAASTIRESLFRLSSDGFVEFLEQRGFRVPTFTIRGMEELVQLRCILEQEAMQKSIERGGISWESDLTAAHHKLAHIEQKMRESNDIEPYMALWTEAEWDFHHTLLSCCGSQTLLNVYRNIYDRFRQHLSNLSSNYGFRDGNIAEHAAILEAALAHDPKQCAEHIELHLIGALPFIRKAAAE